MGVVSFPDSHVLPHEKMRGPLDLSLLGVGSGYETGGRVFEL